MQIITEPVWLVLTIYMKDQILVSDFYSESVLFWGFLFENIPRWCCADVFKMILKVLKTW